MHVTSFGITKELNSLPSIYSFLAPTKLPLIEFVAHFVMFETTITVSNNDPHWLNAPLPTLVTLSESVIDASAEQRQKAYSPMLVTLSGIVTDSNP